MDSSSAGAVDPLEVFRAVLPAGVALAGGPIGEASNSPYRAEAAAIERAGARRRRSFAAGRTYARAAMSQLGWPPVELAALPSGAPDWPAGLTGSISHARDFCVAAVATSSLFRAMGIDVELDSPLSVEARAIVCRRDELEAMTPASGGLDPAKLAFVVKEAFFKLYHPLTGHFLAFHDAAVRLDPRRGAFSLRVCKGAPDALGRRSFEGACGHAGGHLFAFVALAV